MRLKHKAAKYYDEDGHRVELLPLLRELAAGEVLDVTLHYYSEPRKPASAKPLRICAIRKSPEQVERAKRKTRRKMRAPHKKPLDPAAIEMSEYFVVGTSLPTDAFSSAQVLELYRLRWQVELAFKRLKSIMQLGQRPKTDPESCRAWLYGKMLYALLCYAIVDKGRSFSPWGIYSKYLEAHESLWRELSVALRLVSEAVRPNIGIPYAPESDPDEYLNHALKLSIHSGDLPRTKYDIRHKTASFMRTLQHCSDEVSTFFQHNRISYVLIRE